MSERFAVDSEVRVPYDPFGDGVTRGIVVRYLGGDQYLINVGAFMHERYEEIFSGAQLKADRRLRLVEDER
jgi:hypothetical protein